MKKIKIETLFLIFFFVLFCSPSLLAQEEIRIKADLVLYDQERDKVSASGNVRVEWRDMRVTTQEITFFISTQELWVPYPLELVLGGSLVRGDEFYYSLLEDEGWVKEAALIYEVGEKGKLYFRGNKIDYLKGKWKGDNLSLTGCEKEPPLYSLRAKEVVIFPQDRIVLEGLSFYFKDKKILELPLYSRILGKGGAVFSPALEYSRKKGWYLSGYYDYLFTENLLLKSKLTVSSLQGIELSIDLVTSLSQGEGGVFWDIWPGAVDTWGGYIYFEKDNLSLWALSVNNERVDDSIISRSPQLVVSYGENPEEGFNWQSTFSWGYFVEDGFSTWRKDLYLNAGWKGKEGGLELFFWNIDLSGGKIIPSWGGKVWWEREIFSKWNLNLSYQFSEVQGKSPFSFDPEDQNIVSLDSCWGNYEESFLRLRGDYDLNKGNWEGLTAGVVLVSEGFSLGVEGVYSFGLGEWEEQRYFVRKKIEDCITLEASWYEPDNSLFLSVNLSGLDTEKKAETLFDEEEEFSPFELNREGGD
ncbi:MAG: hypothetical protein PWP57_780 [Candidatus Atribacteria bacterium]|nr:hypothetical protein [Candidatus Atribacteria bacterium]